jgi:hypothetical protein
MTLHRLEAAPPPALARALAGFEMSFTYPLGPGRTFRISHGEDYPRFFRAIGKACSFVEEHDGRVLGVLGVAVRPLLLPDGSERMAGYFGDLKLAPEARSGFVLRRLVSAAAEWLKPQTDCAYSVVMDGTKVVPTEYTGRLGIPEFRELGKVMVLRLVHPDADKLMREAKPEGESSSPRGLMETNPSTLDVLEGYFIKYIGVRRIFTLRGIPAERSEILPVGLPRDVSFGRLEDTRRAKRLIADDGVELKSAHVACFIYLKPSMGAKLLREALQIASTHGFPALFTAVPASQANELCTHLADLEITRAPATIYGTGLPAGHDWNINTSEI